MNNRSAQLTSRFKELEGATIVEIREAMDDISTIFADGFHPNDTGQEIIARLFLQALEQNRETGSIENSTVAHGQD